MGHIYFKQFLLTVCRL